MLETTNDGVEIEQMKKLLGLDKKEKAVKTRATNP